MNKTSIATKNDNFRKTFLGGKVFLTPGVIESKSKEKVINAVKEFEDFNEDNDPYGERDCAIFKVGGEDFMFKIDYYDSNYECFQEDGNRVLTIMRADEY